MSDDLRIRVWLNIGIANADRDDEFVSDDYTRSEWDLMPQKDKDDYLSMLADDHLSNCLDHGAAVIEDDE